MAIKKFDKKYISIFLDRFIPNFFKNKYPQYKKLIQHYLEYLEQDNKAFEIMSNLQKYIDIDKVDNISDPVVRQQIIDKLYNQFLGSQEAQYLSSLLDEILFLKQHKSILKKKGLKVTTLLVLNYTLNGYFRIENITPENKLHNGIFKYNSQISYNSSMQFIENYIYLVVSEFNLSEYQNILKYLNPAGMAYISHIQKNFYKDSDGNYIYNNWSQVNNGQWNIVIS